MVVEELQEGEKKVAYPIMTRNLDSSRVRLCNFQYPVSVSDHRHQILALNLTQTPNSNPRLFI